MTPRSRSFAILGAVLAVSGCKRANMETQQRARPWDANPILPHGTTMQPLPPGTVARTGQPPVPEPERITLAMLDRGQQRYAIFCTPCHGAAGHADGMVVQRGFPAPADFDASGQRALSAAAIEGAIAYGHGTMLGEAERIGPADRWAITAYVRALQFSARAPAAMLPPTDLERLGRAR